MNAQDEYLQLKNHWRDKILSSYYVVVGIVFLAELVLFLYMYILTDAFHYNPVKYVFLYVIIPTSINLISVGCAQFIQKHSESELVKKYAVVCSLLIICTVICTIHSFFLISSAAFVAPIVVSCILDDEKVTKMSGIASAILLVVTSFLAPIFDDAWKPSQRWYNVIAGLVLLSVVYYICQSLCSYTKEKNEIIFQTSLTQERMHNAIRMDAMTGLFNHSEFYHCLEEGIRWCHDNDKTISVVVIDVDFFKSVNDTYGHDKGDIVLIKIAEILKSQCSERAKAFRYGGEEFGMILYDYTQELTFDLIENIRQMIYQEKFSFMPDRHCSISAGIYQYNGEDMSSEEVFEKADKAMYQAKQNGRNRTVCADI